MYLQERWHDWNNFIEEVEKHLRGLQLIVDQKKDLYSMLKSMQKGVRDKQDVQSDRRMCEQLLHDARKHFIDINNSCL